MEVWALKMETWRVCRPEVADSHNFDEEQDPIRIKMKSWIRIRIKMKSWIRIRIKVKSWIRIRISDVDPELWL